MPAPPFFALAFLVFFGSKSAFAEPLPVAFSAAFYVETLPLGTRIVLETAGQIRSDDAAVGSLVALRVREDVVVGGHVLIRTGALAMGRVKHIEEASYNDPAFVTLEATSVQMVDGQRIGLAFGEQIFRGKRKSEGAVIEIGQPMEAFTASNVEVRFE